MLSHMSRVRKILPGLLCLAMLAGGAALFTQDAAAQAPEAPAPEAPAAAAPEAAAAPAPPKIDTGDTAWVLVSTALVLAMTAPGVALFYGGMVRSKNALSTVLQSFIILCLISVQWVLWGYSLAFGPDKGHIVGGLEWMGLNGVGVEPGDRAIFRFSSVVLTEPVRSDGTYGARRRGVTRSRRSAPARRRP